MWGLKGEYFTDIAYRYIRQHTTTKKSDEYVWKINADVRTWMSRETEVKEGRNVWA